MTSNKRENKCLDCPRQIDTKYKRCYECAKKHKEEKDSGGIDLNKEINIQLWVLGLIYVLGIMTGLWLG